MTTGRRATAALVATEHPVDVVKTGELERPGGAWPPDRTGRPAKRRGPSYHRDGGDAVADVLYGGNHDAAWVIMRTSRIYRLCHDARHACASGPSPQGLGGALGLAAPRRERTVHRERDHHKAHVLQPPRLRPRRILSGPPPRNVFDSGGRLGRCRLLTLCFDAACVVGGAAPAHLDHGLEIDQRRRPDGRAVRVLPYLARKLYRAHGKPTCVPAPPHPGRSALRHVPVPRAARRSYQAVVASCHVPAVAPRSPRRSKQR